MSKFIREYPNAIRAKECDDIVKKFNDYDKDDKVDYNTNEHQDSTILRITNNSIWKKEDALIYDIVSEYLQTYGKEYLSTIQLISDMKDIGYTISCRHPAVQEEIRLDSQNIASSNIFLSFIFYLNDTGENSIDFINHDKIIKAERGKLLVFPSSFPYSYKRPISTQKEYVLSSWIEMSSDFEGLKIIKLTADAV